ncbi:hypothetical protein M2651_13945 [Clostridium sp. SYSU_GA19001]|uniref:hypothetical protein n=1 Tax=Clostridium caldaquaticum TaxID=2940653 RepID=UPI0020778142|nr:hypothetical protein [Clostridium caldaquaticum]MCM8712098.1 hypothetical protein [Clostridium caldaquaticum]
MVEKLIIEIEQEMIKILNNMQMEELHKVLLKKLQGATLIDEANNKDCENEEVDYCNLFICAKRVEGCSEKSIKYYKSTIENMLISIKGNTNERIFQKIQAVLNYYNNSSFRAAILF